MMDTGVKKPLFSFQVSLFLGHWRHFNAQSGGAEALATYTGLGTADTQTNAARLFAGLKNNGEPAAEGVHTGLVEGIEAGGIAISGGEEAAGTTHPETQQGRIHRTKIAVLIYHRYSHIRKVLAIRGKSYRTGFQNNMMRLPGGTHKHGIHGTSIGESHRLQLSWNIIHIFPDEAVTAFQGFILPAVGTCSITDTGGWQFAAPAKRYSVQEKFRLVVTGEHMHGNLIPLVPIPVG